jgi:hypothetical protein
VEILDSGNRRHFDTGAVRDISDDKGRCDLLPLDVVAGNMKDTILEAIYQFTVTGDVAHLYRVLNEAPHRLGFVTKANMYLELAKHFAEGCKKYGPDNWRKGIPACCYVDSSVRHYLKFLCGYNDEPHSRAFVWNVACCCWTCEHKPELNSYKKEDD